MSIRPFYWQLNLDISPYSYSTSIHEHPGYEPHPGGEVAQATNLPP